MQVVGENGSWLQINRVGYEVWLADWVNYSRLDSSEPVGSQQPTAPIDNCCFVDRQCQSDQEWIDGYWAYQTRQCAAPAQPQPATPAQPVASAPATVDNCCSLDRQCQTDADWLGGYWAFQNNQCAAPAQPSMSAPSRPLIQGSDRFVRHVGVVLDLMEREAPQWYNYAISGLSFIVEVPIPDQDMTHTCTALAYTSERKPPWNLAGSTSFSSTVGAPSMINSRQLRRLSMRLATYTDMNPGSLIIHRRQASRNRCAGNAGEE